jgi:hypothetical protein
LSTNSEYIPADFSENHLRKKYSVALTVGNWTTSHAQPAEAFPVDDDGILRVNMNLFAQKGAADGVLQISLLLCSLICMF